MSARPVWETTAITQGRDDAGLNQHGDNGHVNNGQKLYIFSH